MKKRIGLFILLLCCTIMGLSVLTAFSVELNKTYAETEPQIIEVPQSELAISNGTFCGIKKTWFVSINPDKETLSFSIKIPDTVTAITPNGFRTTWTSAKTSAGAVNDNDNVGSFKIVSIDFTEATNLVTIDTQAAMNVTSLTGVIDLSNTKVQTIALNAFRGCSSLGGVILPTTLKYLGDKSGTSGSVFYDCTSLQFLRVAGGDPNAAFELPDGLEFIGATTFRNCAGLPANTTAIIPASVTKIGNEVFNGTPAITMFIVKTDNAKNYNGGAFKYDADSYGLGKRLTVFNSPAAKSTFSPSGFSSYKNSIVYEYTLNFGDYSEPKLWGQPVNVCKNADGTWSVNDNYVFPEAEMEDVPAGYTGGWMHNGEVLTASTAFSPSGEELTLTVGKVLANPTIEFIVDGKVVESDRSFISLNLSNDKQHTIGVQASHPAEDVRVKFEYKWTDVWDGGKEGPRMSEAGFGRYNSWTNSEVTNTITIDGPTHERTYHENYTGEDYGHGYYLLEIYAYYVPISGGQYTFFYKSSGYGIAIPDPERTVDTVYLFEVITSDPVKQPEVAVDDLYVGYGYEKAEFQPVVDEQPGCTYVYQWYESTEDEDWGAKLSESNHPNYSVPMGKDVGTYYYWLRVGGIKEDNGDMKWTDTFVKLTVQPKTVTVTPDLGQNKYVGQNDKEFTYTLSEDIAVNGALRREAGETEGSYLFTIGSLASDNYNYVLEMNEENVFFTIKPYFAEAIFSSEEPMNEKDWYKTEVTVTPPEGHFISTDGGLTWSMEPIVLDRSNSNFEYMLRSDLDDETKGAIAYNSKQLKIDTVYPLIFGIEDGKTYCIEIQIKVFDANLDTVTIDGELALSKDDTYMLYAGEHSIVVCDMAGNSVTINITVNDEHTFGELSIDESPNCTETGIGHRHCAICSYMESEVVPALGHREEIIPGKPATCAEVGLTEGIKCSLCEEILKAQETIPALEHDWAEWTQIKAPTCTVDGAEERKCNRCGATETRKIDATGHIETEWILGVEATCLNEGCQHKICKECKAILEVKVISALEHNLESVEGKPATCTEPGYTAHQVCTRCNSKVGYEVIPTIGHSEGEWQIDKQPTCTEIGCKHKECITCGVVLEREVIKKTPHNWDEGEETINPTCTAAGLRIHTCKDCNETKMEVISALGHSLESVEGRPATCTEPGYTAHQVCTRCNSKVGYEVIPTIGHSESEWKIDKQPTCTETGCKHKECITCGVVLERGVIE